MLSHNVLSGKLQALLFFILLFPFISFSQEIDSLEQLLTTDLSNEDRISVITDLVWLITENDSDRAFELMEEAKIIASKLDNKSEDWLMKLDYYYGTIYRSKGDNDISREYYLKYKDKKEKVEDKEAVASVLYQLAILDYNEGKYEASMEEYLESYKIFTGLKDTLNMARALDGMSSVYHGLWKNELSLEKRKEALILYEAMGDPKGLQAIYQNMAVSHGRVNELDSAIVYFKKAETFILVNNDEQGLGYLYENLGTVYAMRGDFVTCKEYVKKSLEIRESLGNKRELMFSYEKYGDVLGFNNEGKKGIPYLDKALKMAKEGGFAPAEEKIHRTLIRNHKKLGNYKLALEHAEKARSLKDSLVSERTTMQINDLDAKYKNSENEKEIIALNAENDIKDTRNFWMMIGLISTLVLLGIIFYFFRQRQKVNQLLAKQNAIISESLEEKNILLKEIHHRVKNNLQVISSLLSLQSRYIKDEKAVEAINEGRARVRSMALIHQSLYQKDNLVGISVKDYFEQLTKELFDTYKINNDKIKLKLDVDEMDLDVDTMIPIGLIVNELVTNSLKYAFEGKDTGEIKVSLLENNNKLKLEIRDNGVGIKDVEGIGKSASFGYKLVNAFSKKMKGDLQIKSEKGTTVSLEFNKNQIAA